MSPDAVRWHDLECGGYAVDLPLWRELAGTGSVLDVGAGTGRVSLDLARRGVRVTATDLEPELLAELEVRAARAGLAITTHLADARALELDAAFDAILVPMQTIQLLGGSEGRARFLARVRAQLAPGGVFAAALADAMDGYGDGSDLEPPLPDMADHDGWLYSSRPVAVRPVDGGTQIERIREVVDPAGRRTRTEDRIVLDRLDEATLAAECVAAGLHGVPTRMVPATEEYVGSVVVLARG